MFWTNKIFFFNCCSNWEKFMEKTSARNWWKHLMNLFWVISVINLRSHWDQKLILGGRESGILWSKIEQIFWVQKGQNSSKTPSLEPILNTFKNKEKLNYYKLCQISCPFLTFFHCLKRISVQCSKSHLFMTRLYVLVNPISWWHGYLLTGSRVHACMVNIRVCLVV